IDSPHFVFARQIKALSFSLFKYIFSPSSRSAPLQNEQPLAEFGTMRQLLQAFRSDSPKVSAALSAFAELERQEDDCRKAAVELRECPDENTHTAHIATFGSYLRERLLCQKWILVGWEGNPILMHYDDEVSTLSIIDPKNPSESYSLEKVSAEDVKNSYFTYWLAHLRLFDTQTQYADIDPCKRFYLQILNLVRGERVSPADHTEKSLSQLLLDKLLNNSLEGRRANSRFRYFAEVWALLSHLTFLQKYRGKRGIEEGEQIAFKRAGEHLADRTLALAEEGVLTEHEKGAALDTLVDAEARVQKFADTYDPRQKPLSEVCLTEKSKKAFISLMPNSGSLSGTERGLAPLVWNACKITIQSGWQATKTICRRPVYRVHDVAKRLWWKAGFYLRPKEIPGDLEQVAGRSSPQGITTSSELLASLEEVRHILRYDQIDIQRRPLYIDPELKKSWIAFNQKTSSGLSFSLTDGLYSLPTLLFKTLKEGFSKSPREYLQWRFFSTHFSPPTEKLDWTPGIDTIAKNFYGVLFSITCLTLLWRWQGLPLLTWLTTPKMDENQLKSIKESCHTKATKLANPALLERCLKGYFGKDDKEFCQKSYDIIYDYKYSECFHSAIWSHDWNPIAAQYCPNSTGPINCVEFRVRNDFSTFTSGLQWLNEQANKLSAPLQSLLSFGSGSVIGTVLGMTLATPPLLLYDSTAGYFSQKSTPGLHGTRDDSAHRLVDIALKLPVPKFGEQDLWDTLPESSLDTYLEAIEHLVWAMNARQRTDTYPLNVLEKVVLYRLLAIGDKLARRHPLLRHHPLPPVLPALLATVTSPLFSATDHRLSASLRETIAYFARQSSQPAFELSSAPFNLSLSPSAEGVPYFEKLPDGDQLKGNPRAIVNHPTIIYLKRFLRDPSLLNGIKKRLELFEVTSEQLSARRFSPEWIEAILAFVIGLFEMDEEKLPPCLPRGVNALINTLRVIGLSHARWKLPEDLIEPFTDAFTPQNRVLFEQKPFKELPWEISKEFRLITADPYDLFNRTLLFLRHQRQVFGDLKSIDQVANEIWRYLFKNDALAAQLRESPQYLTELARQFEELIDESLDSDQPEFAAFVTIFAHRIGRFINAAPPAYPDFRGRIYDEILPEIRKQSGEERVQKILERLCESYADFSVGFDSTSPKELQAVAEDLYAWHAHIQQFPTPREPGQIDIIYSRLQPLMLQQAARSYEKRCGIFKRMLQVTFSQQAKFSNASKGLGWIGGGGKYTDGRYMIDLNKGAVAPLLGVKRSQELPAAVLGDPLFKELCVDSYEFVEQYSEGHYIVYPQRLQILVDKEQKVHYSKEIHGEFYELISSEEQIEGLAVSDRGKHRIWLHRGDSPHLLFVPKDPTQSLFYSTLTAEPFLTWALSGYKAAYHMGYYYRFVGEGPSARCERKIPLESVDPSLHFLATVCDEAENIFCWCNADDPSLTLRSVEIPRLGLKFQVKRQGKELKLESTQHPGYFLKSPRQIAAIDPHHPFLLLERGSGEQIAIVPAGTLTTNDSDRGHLEREVSWSPILKKGLPKGTSYALKEGKLLPLDTASQLYLIHLHLAHGRDEEALKCLTDVVPLDKFDATQEALLCHSLEFLDEQPPSPLRARVVMGIVALIQKNRQKYPSVTESGTNHEKISFNAIWKELPDKVITPLRAVRQTPRLREEMRGFFRALKGLVNGESPPRRPILEQLDRWIEEPFTALSERVEKLISQNDFSSFSSETLTVEQLYNTFRGWYYTSDELLKREDPKDSHGICFLDQILPSVSLLNGEIIFGLY
ncbi:MAG: hypothetical protein KDK40_03680, partial [Chlamydiia bacterium]|nr:hypothetical protein [Chlamydiia bacterium]